jgi:hypothetical protein
MIFFGNGDTEIYSKFYINYKSKLLAGGKDEKNFNSFILISNTPITGRLTTFF